MKIDKIEDNGRKFIIYGPKKTYEELKNTFDNLGLGISVSESQRGLANILYTENNRDIVLKLLKEKKSC